ncbi:Type IV fimbrial biogenesis protein PilY1 [Collimonas arenae]|uniref:Type IV fimbrial biogenesis protein PilY1 n=1 Tax=Collimonas arenae TaxID=279058 RepID=A0A0A1FKG0_9BURK|nr:PilC/PilY family type IV pilus protein [Collimonas arenae]AIY44164.1 Type IV fimbrial biogenesis protein PilY1 [Collimonas arenae]
MKATFSGVCAIVLSSFLVYARAAETPDLPPFIYTSSYDAVSWQGHVKAYPIGKDGVSSIAQWDAADLIPPWQTRHIDIATASVDANTAPFEWSQLNDAQQAALLSEYVLEYLRGSDKLEVLHGGGFRNRKGKLGDIIYSAPLYVGRSDSAYHLMSASEGGNTYPRYVNSKKQRQAMLYVGANDGMLHAFDALSGVETAAFIPYAIFDALPGLSSTDYVHRPFVDGLLTVGDAYLGNPGSAAWKTILLGSTGRGAKSVFALDASNPPAAAPLLWERSAADDGKGKKDDDMGYLTGEAFAIRLSNSKWAAIYSNGYESENLDAVLYLVELASGGLIRKISVGKGDAEAPNGLATPALAFNQQRAVSTAYAGDLQGRLWKIDLSANEAPGWQIAFNNQPLFIATDSAGKLQSLPLQPLLEHHAKGGTFVMFSGGKAGDGRIPGVAQKQSLYGIWEKPGSGPVSGRKELRQQTLTETSEGLWQLSSNGVNWTTSRGWYIDLPAKLGYVVGKLQIIDGVLWVMTYSPVQEKSYLVAIDYNTGGATSDAVLTGHPKSTPVIEVPASIVPPMFIKLPDGRKQLVVSGRDGAPQAVDINPASQRPLRTWHQLPVPSSVVDPD